MVVIHNVSTPIIVGAPITVYRCSAIEKGDKVSSGLDELFDQQVSHLSQSHLNFFAKWYSLIAEEERHSKAREGPPLWLLDPENRCAVSVLV